VALALPWPEFAREAPELAERGAEMLRSFTLGYLATLRPGGSPRVHPVTLTVDDAGVYLFAVAATPKGSDLRRDPRYAIHAFPTFLDEGFHDDEFAFGGLAVEVAIRLSPRPSPRSTTTPSTRATRCFLDLSWALHKRRDREGRPVYLRWRLASGSTDAATMAGL
jgi:Pyridoxamine 5'-phosphate oxidase